MFGLKSQRWCDEYNKTFRQYKDKKDKKCFEEYKRRRPDGIGWSDESD